MCKLTRLSSQNKNKQKKMNDPIGISVPKILMNYTKWIKIICLRKYITKYKLLNYF